MKDITVSSNLKALQGAGPSQGLGAPKVGTDTKGPSFADTLAQSLKEVNTLQKDADVAIQDFVAGRYPQYSRNHDCCGKSRYCIPLDHAGAQ